MTKQELLEAAKKAAAAPSCYPGLKTLIEAWEKALGTPDEHAAAEKMLAGLEECVTGIDGLIAFAATPEGAKVLGGEAAAASTLAAAEGAKAGGTRCCIWPAGTDGAILVGHRRDLGCGEF